MMPLAARERVDDLVVDCLRPMLGLGIARITRRAEDWPSYELHLDALAVEHGEVEALRIVSLARMIVAAARHGAPLSFVVLDAAQLEAQGEPSRVIWQRLVALP